MMTHTRSQATTSTQARNLLAKVRWTLGKECPQFDAENGAMRLPFLSLKYAE